MRRTRRRFKLPTYALLAFMLLFFGMYVQAAVFGPPAAVTAVQEKHEAFQFFSFMTSDHYDAFEKTMLWIVLGTALAALLYAWLLVGQVIGRRGSLQQGEAIRFGLAWSLDSDNSLIC